MLVKANSLIRLFILLVTFYSGAVLADIDKTEAVKKVSQAYPGKIVRVQSTGDGFRIRIIQKDGRVITLFVDKKTGAIQKDE
ncbi:PepSY domain-containing protein [Algicola sagamiensis]|uniref:PepSY domain-containing protein n=1 Tax=Algicola sagamiensis TaxID=163869 RepID=UPI0003785C5E|nr:PepSY domain-containing protein [Algicola sagamiensis]